MVDAVANGRSNTIDDELQGGIHVVTNQHDTTLTYDDEDFYPGVNDIGWIGMKFGRQGIDGECPSGHALIGRVVMVRGGAENVEAAVIMDELKVAVTASALRALADTLDGISEGKCDIHN